MGAFLFMGLIGIIVASIVNIWLASSMMEWIISVAAVLIFTGLTAYDTQKLREEYMSGGNVYGFSSQERSAINGALILYLDFVNIFIHLLNLLGQKRD
jgi:FtsH-binding integral membrane protein